MTEPTRGYPGWHKVNAMGMIKCDSCGELIDTDDFPGAYDEKADKWWCWLCWPDYDSDVPISMQRYSNWTQGK